IGHQNIVAFLERIPRSRQHRVCFEDLVREPGAAVDRLCAFLGLEATPEMLNPYQDKRTRMTDGTHSLSRGLTDIKFHEHKGIDAGVADRWREEAASDLLSDTTWALAESFGYERSPGQRKEAARRLLARIDTLSEGEVHSLLARRAQSEN